MAQRKQASLNDYIVTHTTVSENAVDPDSEHDYTDEDGSSDWEDIIEDGGEFRVDKKYFQRVDSKGNFTSRRSLITLMLQSDARSALVVSSGRAGRLALRASPNGSDNAPLMMKGGRRTLEVTKEIPRCTAKVNAISTHGDNRAPVLSQEVTRRNMLATELNGSLCSHLLWERACNSSMANAALKSWHACEDLTNFMQYPEKLCIKSNDRGSFDWLKNFRGYHDRGW
jgi:hypothetical protein